MNPQQQQAYVDAAAQALDLPIAMEHRAGVLQYFAIAAQFAQQVQAVALPVEQDSALVFTPVSPARSRA
mgnify:CR=1 FL=1